jgi:hypothetical protein
MVLTSMFLNMEDDKTMSPQTKPENRKTDLAFWVDILEHLNLNAILQENTFYMSYVHTAV